MPLTNHNDSEQLIMFNRLKENLNQAQWEQLINDWMKTDDMRYIAFDIQNRANAFILTGLAILELYQDLISDEEKRVIQHNLSTIGGITITFIKALSVLDQRERNKSTGEAK